MCVCILEARHRAKCSSSSSNTELALDAFNGSYTEQCSFHARAFMKCTEIVTQEIRNKMKKKKNTHTTAIHAIPLYNSSAKVFFSLLLSLLFAYASIYRALLNVECEQNKKNVHLFSSLGELRYNKNGSSQIVFYHSV